jgi:dihydrofolate reductase
MRKVILSMMVSSDGLIEGADPQKEWFFWDDEMERYMLEFMSTLDTFMYGRVAYEVMATYWPDVKGPLSDLMNNTPKIIFSRTLKKAEWKNSRVVHENILSEIAILKQQPGKDIALFAGADIASYFLSNDLIDEYRFMVNPVILGAGKPLFSNSGTERILRLISTRSFACGNVLLTYASSSMKFSV